MSKEATPKSRARNNLKIFAESRAENITLISGHDVRIPEMTGLCVPFRKRNSGRNATGDVSISSDKTHTKTR